MIGRGEGDLSPEQEEELARWQRRAKDKKEEFTEEEQKTWGWTKKTREEQQEADEQANPSTRKKLFR